MSNPVIKYKQLDIIKSIQVADIEKSSSNIDSECLLKLDLDNYTKLKKTLKLLIDNESTSRINDGIVNLDAAQIKGYLYISSLFKKSSNCYVSVNWLDMKNRKYIVVIKDGECEKDKKVTIDFDKTCCIDCDKKPS
jgi:hypothetical protein